LARGRHSPKGRIRKATGHSNFSDRRQLCPHCCRSGDLAASQSRAIAADDRLEPKLPNAAPCSNDGSPRKPDAPSALTMSISDPPGYSIRGSAPHDGHIVSTSILALCIHEDGARGSGSECPACPPGGAYAGQVAGPRARPKGLDRGSEANKYSPGGHACPLQPKLPADFAQFVHHVWKASQRLELTLELIASNSIVAHHDRFWRSVAGN